MKKTTSQRILDILNEAKYATLHSKHRFQDQRDVMPIVNSVINNQHVTDVPEEWKIAVKVALDTGTLMLNNKNVSEIPDIVFDKLSVVANAINTVNLSHNSFNEIPERIKEFKNIEKLFLQHNKIKVLSQFVFNFKKLTTLYISNNDLTEIPSGIGELENLKFLEMKKNKITKLPTELSKLKKLIEITYDGRLISHLPIANPNDVSIID